MYVNMYKGTYIGVYNGVAICVARSKILKIPCEPTGEVQRAYKICYAQQSVRFPQVDLGHFVKEFVISLKYFGTWIIDRDSHSNQPRI
jgi:hypothetical protein